MSQVTSRNTKNEILDAYEKLKTELKKVTKANQLAQTPKASPEKIEPKADKKQTPEKLQTAENLNIEVIISNLEKLQTNFGESSSQLQTKLTAEATHLQEIHKNTTSVREQLKNVHNLEVQENTLDLLIEEYKQTTENNKKELLLATREQKEKLKSAHKSWNKEKEEISQQIEEEQRAHEQIVERNNEEYQYNIELAEKIDNEFIAEETKRLQQIQNDIKEQKEIEWEEKEKNIATQEKEYEEFKEKNKNQPDELKKATKKAEEEGNSIAKKQSKIQLDLLKKEQEGEQRLLELRTKTLEETIENQTQQVQKLSKQLESTIKQAQDLAIKAIEGSANANSLQNVKEIAMEQAKNTSKGK